MKTNLDVSFSNIYLFSMFVHRRLMILEDQYKQALNEIKEKKSHLSEVRPTSAKMKQDTNKIKLNENQLDKSLVKYNRLQAGNKTLR